MAISTNGGSNPTSVVYNDNNCTEVWYKSSPSAEAIMVWPATLGHISIGNNVGDSYNFTCSIYNGTTLEETYVSSTISITNPDGAVYPILNRGINNPKKFTINAPGQLANKVKVICANNGAVTEYPLASGNTWNRNVEIFRTATGNWSITGGTSTSVLELNGIYDEDIIDIKVMYHGNVEEQDAPYFSVDITMKPGNWFYVSWNIIPSSSHWTSGYGRIYLYDDYPNGQRTYSTSPGYGRTNVNSKTGVANPHYYGYGEYIIRNGKTKEILYHDANELDELHGGPVYVGKYNFIYGVFKRQRIGRQSYYVLDCY